MTKIETYNRIVKIGSPEVAFIANIILHKFSKPGLKLTGLFNLIITNHEIRHSASHIVVVDGKAWKPSDLHNVPKP